MTTHINQSSHEREIVSSRLFHSSRELVWRAWTEPEHLQNWWGPAGFTNTFHEFDLRVGGKWRFVMHGPEKGNYPNECAFVEIARPSRLAWDRISKPLFRVLVIFEEVSAEQTLIVFRQMFETERECSKIKPFAVEKNEENFDRLEMELSKMATIG